MKLPYLFIMLLSCQTFPARSSDSVFKDLEVTVDGFAFEGIGVLPMQESFEMEAHGRHHPEQIQVSTCNRAEPPFYLTWRKKRLRWAFLPNLVEEADCILKIAFLDASEHSQYAAFIFENPIDKLPARADCNGRILMTQGTTFCQSMLGTTQMISFPEQAIPVVDGCDMPLDADGDRMQWLYTAKQGFCTYIFKTAAGTSHRLVNFGYTSFSNP